MLQREVGIKKTADKAVLFFTKNQIGKTDQIIFAIHIISMLCVFINGTLQIITGPIMTICFTYLYFHGYKSLVTSIIITANDALGCIFMGSISFPYLLAVFIVLTFFSKGYRVKVRCSQMIAGIVMLMMLVTLYSYEIVSVKNIIYTLTFICAAAQSISGQEDRAMFFKGIAITVFLISIHTCITGGVEFYELNKYSTEFLRKGILGVGIGDSNFSTLLLNFGITTVLFDRDFKWYMKVIMTACNVYAMTVTLSTSGLIGLFLVICGFVYVNRTSIPKKVRNTIIFIGAIFLISNIYISLPDTMRNATIDAYISRMQERLLFLNADNISDFTSGRSELSNEAIQYIFNEQGIFRMLFGYNSLFVGSGRNVPHNTYVGLLLQIGLVGTTVSLVYILRSLVKCWRDMGRNRMEIMLKILFLYYFMNLSIYQGNVFALAYIVLIVL